MASNPKLTETLHRISDYLSSHETHIKAFYDDNNNPDKSLATEKNVPKNINICSPGETMLRQFECEGNESFSLNIGGVDVRVYAKTGNNTMHVNIDGSGERDINMQNSILSQFKDNDPRGWGSNGGNNAGAIFERQTVYFPDKDNWDKKKGYTSHSVNDGFVRTIIDDYYQGSRTIIGDNELESNSLTFFFYRIDGSAQDACYVLFKATLVWD